MKIRSSILALCTFLVAQGLHAAEVVVYSARNEQLIKPVFERFTRETGIKVKFLTDKEAPLIARLKAEGAAMPADVLLTVDAGNLWLAAQQGLFRPLSSPTLTANIPAHLRDPDNRWFGLSVRARTIVYNPSKVKPAALSTYEALAGPEWKGRLCLRTSKKVYNQSLVAMMIAQHGEAKTEEIVRGWVANLATEPFSDDARLVKAVAAGQCEVGVVNTYYFGRLLKKNPKLNAKLFWPNQNDSGVHVNVSGAGVTRHAKHPAEAQQLLEWMSQPTAQSLFAGLNLEYPVNPKVQPDPIVAAWGRFKPNIINVAKAGELQAAAVKLMDRAGYR